MKKFLILLLVFVAGNAFAQNRVRNIIDTLRKNSIAIRLADASLESQRLENNSVRSLSNPEVGFNYLGISGDGGVRKDLSVMQSFTAQNLAGVNGKIARNANSVSEYEHLEALRDFDLEATLVLIDFAVAKNMLDKLGERANYAGQLVEAEKRRLELGESSVIEYHKAEVYLAKVNGLKLRCETELMAQTQEILRLNGGVGVPMEVYNIDIHDFDSPNIADDFEIWYQDYTQQRPNIAADAGVEGARLNLKSTRMDWIPEIGVGYMQEITDDEKIRGLATSFSVPVWSNSRNVKKAKIDLDIAEAQRDMMQSNRYSAKRVQYERCKSLRKLCDYFHESLPKFGSIDNFYKAHQMGEISLIDFINESDMYYDFYQDHVETERERMKAEAELLR